MTARTTDHSDPWTDFRDNDLSLLPIFWEIYIKFRFVVYSYRERCQWSYKVFKVAVYTIPNGHPFTWCLSLHVAGLIQQYLTGLFAPLDQIYLPDCNQFPQSFWLNTACVCVCVWGGGGGGGGDYPPGRVWVVEPFLRQWDEVRPHPHGRGGSASRFSVHSVLVGSISSHDTPWTSNVPRVMSLASMAIFNESPALAHTAGGG